MAWPRVLGFLFLLDVLTANFYPAVAQSSDLNIIVDPANGAKIGTPRSMPGSQTSRSNSVGWKSVDGRIDLLMLRFPATRTLDEIYQRLRTLKGRQIIRDERYVNGFVLEGSDMDGAEFIVRVGDAAGEKRGFSITYRAQAQDGIAALAQQIAESYRGGLGQFEYVPMVNVDGRPTPRSEDELTRIQRQALQAQLTAHGHRGSERDGTFGPGTRGAIRSLQRTYNRPETGILTAQMINELMRGDTYIPEIIRLEGRDRFTAVDYDSLNKDKCGAIRAELDTMAMQASIRFASQQVQAGREIELSWSFAPQQRRHPMYLMIAFDQPVRFAGKGFYVLMPEARAPFTLAHANEKTRVVVPLYVTGGATSRTIKVTPVLAGSLDVSTAIVAASGCGEQIVTLPERANLAVTPGWPTIEVVEDAPLDPVLKTILSPFGNRMIAVTGENSFQLIDGKTGRSIVSLPGKEPRFSPTGRFITSMSDQSIVLRDALDGERLSDIGGEFSWDNKDSFILSGLSGDSGVEVRFPAVLGQSGERMGFGCRTCSGLDGSAVKIDLENNLVLGTNRNAPFSKAAFSLTESFERTAPNDAMPKFGSEAQFAEYTSRVVPLSFPNDWEFIEKPQFPYLARPDPAANQFGDPRRRFFRVEMAPLLRQGTATSGNSPIAVAPARSYTLSRNVSTVKVNFDGSRRSFSNRLAEFGIDEHPSIPFTPVLNPLKPIDVWRKDWRENRYRLHAYTFDPTIRIDTEANECELGETTPDAGGGITVALNRHGFFTASFGDYRLSLLGGGCMAGSMGDSDPIFGLLDSRRPGVMQPIISGVPFWEIRNPGGACEGVACDYHAVISHGRYLLIWSSYSGAIEVVDLEKRETSAFVPFRGDALDQIALTPDARMLIQRNRDGTFAIHDLKLGIPVNRDSYRNAGRVNIEAVRTAVLYGRYADDEIVVWTPSGHFDATYEGAAQVHLRFQGLPDLYTFDQFASLIQRPGLAKKVMQGAFKDEPITYKIPPTLVGDLNGDSEKISITLRQTSGQRLASILIYQDGVHGDPLPPGDGKQISTTLKRMPGVRWVAAVGIDQDGLVSQPVIKDLGPTTPSRTLRILGIGIDRYASSSLRRLNFARSDVRRVVNAAVKAKSQVYSRVEPVVLEDASATRDAILDALARVVNESSAESDLMLVFAGHGLKGSDGSYYLALSQTNIDDLKTTALGWDDVYAILTRAKSRVFVLLDSCHSGDAGRGLLSTNDDVVTGLLSASGNVIVLSGAKGREFSLENGSVGGGYFSVAVAHAFSNADHDGNGILEASELFTAVKASVVKATDGRQTPWIARNRMIGDFSVF